MRLLILNQIRAKGCDWLQEQMIQVIERHLEPNADFWNSILSNNIRAGLILKGVSEHTGVKYDARDVGFINCGTGNHIASTIEDNLTEGFLYADKIRTMLLGLQKWHDKKSFLDKTITAPLYGNKF